MKSTAQASHSFVLAGLMPWWRSAGPGRPLPALAAHRCGQYSTALSSITHHTCLRLHSFRTVWPHGFSELVAQHLACAVCVPYNALILDITFFVIPLMGHALAWGWVCLPRWQNSTLTLFLRVTCQTPSAASWLAVLQQYCGLQQHADLVDCAARQHCQPHLLPPA